GPRRRPRNCPDSRLVNGVGTFSFNIATVGSFLVSAEDTANGIYSETRIVATSGPSIHLQLFAPITISLDTPFAVGVAARNDADVLATDFTGTISIQSSDPAAALPPDFTLSGGEATTQVTFHTAGVQSLTVRSSDATAPPVTARIIVG